MKRRRGRSGLAPAGFVDARVATHLLWHLGSRIHAVVSSRGAAKTTPWRVAAGASLAADLAVAMRLRRDPEFHLVPRLAIDAADLALWCWAAGDDPDTTSDSVIPGVGLAAEAGARIGMRGMVVPAFSALVMGVVRKRRGHDLRLWQAGWQVMGVLGGMGLSVSAARRRQVVEGEHRRDLEARLQASELAGYHSLVSDTDPVADRLQRATALIDLSGPQRERRSALNAWKAALGEVTRERAAFLADVLLTWQAAHNLHPDLHSVVRLELEPGAGTVLLTLSQAEELRRILEGLELRGVVPVRLIDAVEARRADGRRDLMVGDHLVALERPAEALSMIYDAIPTSLAMSTLWFLPPLSETREAVPLRWTVVPAAVTAATGIWATVRANRDGLAPRAPVIALSALASAVYTYGSAASARHPHSPDGASWFPWMFALQGYELVTEHCGPELTPRQRLLVRMGVPCMVALGWLRSPRPRSLRALVSEVVWPIGIGMWARATARAIEADSESRAKEIAREDAQAVRAAYEEGRNRVLGYLSAELEFTERDFAEHADAMDERHCAEARRRLEEIRRELDQLIDLSASA